MNSSILTSAAEVASSILSLFGTSCASREIFSFVTSMTLSSEPEDKLLSLLYSSRDFNWAESDFASSKTINSWLSPCSRISKRSDACLSTSSAPPSVVPLLSLRTKAANDSMFDASSDWISSSTGESVFCLLNFSEVRLLSDTFVVATDMVWLRPEIFSFFPSSPLSGSEMSLDRTSSEQSVSVLLLPESHFWSISFNCSCSFCFSRASFFFFESLLARTLPILTKRLSRNLFFCCMFVSGSDPVFVFIRWNLLFGVCTIKWPGPIWWALDSGWSVLLLSRDPLALSSLFRLGTETELHEVKSPVGLARTSKSIRWFCRTSKVFAVSFSRTLSITWLIWSIGSCLFIFSEYVRIACLSSPFRSFTHSLLTGPDPGKRPPNLKCFASSFRWLDLFFFKYFCVIWEICWTRRFALSFTDAGSFISGTRSSGSS